MACLTACQGPSPEGGQCMFLCTSESSEEMKGPGNGQLAARQGQRETHQHATGLFQLFRATSAKCHI